MTNPIIWLLALGHLVVDMGQGAIPILLPVLKDTFDLSYSSVAMVTLATSVSSSVIQPLFGVWSDRAATRWLLPAGCLITTVGLAVTAVAPLFSLILFAILISGLGIAAYHPEGSRATFLATRDGRRGASMAIFSIGGNLGFALGPLAATTLITTWGRPGFIGFLVPGVASALILWFLIPAINRATSHVSPPTKKASVSFQIPPQRTQWGPLALLTTVVTTRSFIHAGMIAFIPLYFVSHLGGTPLYAGHILTVFLLAGALGTLVGGPLGDRWGRRRLLLISFAVSVPFLMAFPYVDGIWRVLCIFVSGFAIIATFSVTVVFAQELAPGNVGLVSGIMMGFAVGMGGVGVIILGTIADVWGVPVVLNIISILPALALLMSLLLPKLPPATIIVPEQENSSLNPHHKAERPF